MDPNAESLRARDMTPEQLCKYSRDHLFHEIKMFYWLASIIDYMDGALHDALLESFLVHLRNLIDFFCRPRERATDVVAEDFFDNPSNWKRNPTSTLEKARERANKELSHLTTGRKEPDDPEKVWDIGALFTEIDQFVHMFIQNASSPKLDQEKFRVFMKEARAEQGLHSSLMYSASTATVQVLSNNATLEMGLFQPRPTK